MKWKAHFHSFGRLVKRLSIWVFILAAVLIIARIALPFAVKAISGTYTNSSVGIWTATGTLLQNAFIHALVPKLDQQVTVEQVEKTEDKK